MTRAKLADRIADARHEQRRALTIAYNIPLRDDDSIEQDHHIRMHRLYLHMAAIHADHARVLEEQLADERVAS